MAVFDESKHPRDDDGKFSKKDYADMSIAELKGMTQKEWRQNTPYEEILANTLIMVLPEYEEKDFSIQVDAVIEGSFDKANTHIKVLDKTPQIYIEKAGMRDLPILMSYGKLCASMFEKSEFSEHAHGLGANLVKQIPKALNNPLYILKGKKEKRIEAVLSLNDSKGRALYTVIELDNNVRMGNKYVEANILVTAFGAKDGYLKKRINESEILYKKRN